MYVSFKEERFLGDRLISDSFHTFKHAQVQSEFETFQFVLGLKLSLGDLKSHLAKVKEENFVAHNQPGLARLAGSYNKQPLRI